MEGEKSYKKIRLRQAVSAVIFRGDKFFMVTGKDWPEGSWCFPQGGILAGETHFHAVEREVMEELGTDKFKILGKSAIDHMYLFPKNIAEKKGCEGQYQTIWFVDFFGDESEIKPNKEELTQCSWFSEEDVISSMAFPEQKETFTKVLLEFRELRSEKIY